MASILGYFGGESKKVARELLTHKLGHVVASDMHSADSPTMDQAVPAVEKLLGKEQAARMFVDIPRQILAGEAIHQEELPQQLGTRRRGLRRLFSRSGV